jgi:hypothetical protein
MCTKFWLENLKGKDCLEDPGVDGRIILEWILEREIGWEVDWIHLAQGRNQWWAVFNTVMNLQVP